MKLLYHQNPHGFSMLEVLITASIVLILVNSFIQILEQSSLQTKMSALNFQTASMIDFWNAGQTPHFLFQKIETRNFKNQFEIYHDVGELRSQIEIFPDGWFKVSFQLIFSDHPHIVSWISEGVIDVPTN